MDTWGGILPIADDDEVIIPATKKVTLDITHPRLKKLLIKDSLRVSTDINNLKLNAFIIHVTRSGSFLIGTEDVIFTNNFTIELAEIFRSEHFVLDDIIEPPNKALITSGTNKFYGVKKNPSWTRLSIVARKDETILNLSENVDWVVGDDIVIASTSMEQEEIEYHTIKTIISSKQIELENKLQYNHYGAGSPTVTDNGTLDQRAEVGVLTRNIKIIGADDSDWGCRIITPKYTARESGGPRVTIEGNIYLQGVEISACGQRDTFQGSLDFPFLNGASRNEINNCVIRDGKGIGVNLEGAANVHFIDSIITNVRKFGIYVRAPNNLSFNRNLILNIVKRPEYSNDEVWDDLIGFFYDSETYLADTKVFITNNSISGVDLFAWVVPGHKCGTTNNNFVNNSGHTARAGWFVSKFPPGGSECMAFSKFIGYKNFDQGFVNRWEIFKIELEKMVFADNKFSLSMNGGSSGDRKYPVSKLKDTTIYGKALSDCDFCYTSKKECETNGIITSLFEVKTYNFIHNINEIPLYNVTSPSYLWGGNQYIENVQFINFVVTNICSKSHTIVTNRFVQDTSVDVKLKNIQLFNVTEPNYFWFNNRSPLKFPGFCAKRHCTGIYNINIQDIDGRYFGFPANFFNNKGIGNDGFCTRKEAWNGWACQDKYMLLSMMHFGGGRSLIIAPLKFSIFEFGQDVSEEDKFLNTVDNQSKFPVIIQRNSYNHIEFSASMSQGILYKLDSYDDNAWAVFRVQITDPAIMSTKVNGKDIEPIAVNSDVIDYSQYADTCGAHAYFSSNYTLIFLVNNKPDCLVKVIKTDSVRVEMRLDLPVKEFYSNIGTSLFRDRLAGILKIPTHRLRIVGIREGSTIVDFNILKENQGTTDSDTGETVETEEQTAAGLEELTNLKNTLIESIDKVAAELDVPVLDVEADVVETEETLRPEKERVFVKHCRFFNTTTYEFIDTEEKEIKSDQGVAETFIRINCKDCVIVNQCKQFFEIACDINEEIMGKEECAKLGTPDLEESDDDDNDTSSSFIISLVSILITVINLLA